MNQHLKVIRMVFLIISFSPGFLPHQVQSSHQFLQLIFEAHIEQGVVFSTDYGALDHFNQLNPL